MLEGLWTAEFGSSTGIFGGGVAVFRDGKVWGGDGGYYYLGQYELTDRSFRVTLEVNPFIPNQQSVFNTANQKVILDWVGSILDETHITAQGHPRGMPQLSFGAKLIKRA